MATVKSRVVTPSNRFSTWLVTPGPEKAWLNALVAFIIGAVFAILLRNLGVAGIQQSGFLPLAVLTGVAAAIGFGSTGRMLTGRRTGWLEALIVVPWGGVVVVATFIVFSRQGNFEAFNPTVPAAGGLVAGILALIPHKGVPRIVGLALVVLAAAGIVIYVTVAP
jgi:hypothetical protein